MQGLMSSFPLTLPHVFARAERLFADKPIVTALGGGRTARITYGEWAERTRRLAGALDRLGVSPDARVATFAWNSARHREVYFAAPCSGRVLHTLNIRLFADQLAYIVDHAQDEIVFVDRSLLGVLWPIIAEQPCVRHIVVMDDGPDEGPAVLPDDPRLIDYEELLAGSEPARFEVFDENRAAAMCYTSCTTGESLTRVVCGGSAVPASLSEAYRERIGLPITQAWGMTETSPVGSIARLRSGDRDAPVARQAELAARQGEPVPLVECRIVDPETGMELPWDGAVSGELQVTGPWVAAAYYRDEGAGAFTEDGWLRTGDVANISAAGSIQLVDRTKDLVKSGGEWISSVELENAIMAHPGVREAAVVAVPDERWGERPLACVVAADGRLSADELREFLDGRVSKWWIPDRFEFLDEVPKTSVGKSSKKTLRKRFS